MSRLPTTDLYFLNACRHSLAGWLRGGPVRQLGPNCFSAANRVLLIRRDSEQLMRHVRQKARNFIYLVDDDIESASQSHELPQDYRGRLIRFHEEYHRALTENADTLVVTSSALLDRFSWHKDVRLLHPVWHLPMAGDAHFSELAKGGPINAVHLGSGSHAPALHFLRPVVETLLEQHRRLHFTYFGHVPAMGALDKHPRVQRLRPRPWWRYRRWIGRQRFHLGLYPLPDTAFNKARSRNKLLEHGVVGAVGIYSEEWQAVSSMTGRAIVAESDPEAWIETLSRTLAKPHCLRALFNDSRSTLDDMNDATIQRRFWSELLGVVI